MFQSRALLKTGKCALSSYGVCLFYTQYSIILYFVAMLSTHLRLQHGVVSRFASECPYVEAKFIHG